MVVMLEMDGCIDRWGRFESTKVEPVVDCCVSLSYSYFSLLLLFREVRRSYGWLPLLPYCCCIVVAAVIIVVVVATTSISVCPVLVSLVMIFLFGREGGTIHTVKKFFHSPHLSSDTTKSVNPSAISII